MSWLLSPLVVRYHFHFEILLVKIMQLVRWTIHNLIVRSKSLLQIRGRIQSGFAIAGCIPINHHIVCKRFCWAIGAGRWTISARQHLAQPCGCSQQQSWNNPSHLVVSDDGLNTRGIVLDGQSGRCAANADGAFVQV